MKKRSIFMMLLFALIAFMPLKAEAKVKLNVSKKTITINETYKLSVKGTGKKVTWKSSDSSICTVSQKGKIRGKKGGTTYIKATVGGKTYSCKVKVVVPSVSTSMSLTKGQKKTIKISNKKKFSKITYKSSNKKVATVTSKGVVKGIKDGVTTIKVTFNKSYTVKVTVKVAYYYSSSTVFIMRGSAKKLTPKNAGSSGTYSVSNPSMGYVSKGVYYSKGYGINTVTYKWGKFRHVFTVKNFCWEAHRGYTKVYPDNTLESIQAAKAAGADSVEIDVRATRDGQFVLAHDASLADVTNGKVVNGKTLNGNIRTYYLSTLQAENIVYKNGVYYHMPTLDEALALCNKLGLNASIEMKTLPSISKYSYLEKTEAEMTKTLCSVIKKYQNSNSLISIIITGSDNAKLLVDNSDHSIPVRVTNDDYNANADLRTYASKYAFIMPTYEFAKKYYNDCLLTLNNPF